MECFLCLEQKQDVVDCVSMNSTTWGELQVKGIIEKHLWATITFKPRSQWLCLTCWRILQEFHEFYVRIENAQLKTEFIIKEELDLPLEVESHNKESIDLAKPEILADQTTVYFVKEEINDSCYNDDTPLIEEDPIDNNENLENKRKIKIKEPTVLAMSTTGSRKIKKYKTRQIDSEKERKPSLKYYYQSTLHCRDYDTFIAKHFSLACSDCNEPFDTFSRLKCHYHDVHNRRGCAVCCETKFFHRSSLVDHINCHLNPKYFKCQFCPKVLKLRRTYNEHMKRHKKNPYCCNTCDKKFQRKCYLELHKQIHMLPEDMKVPCTECDKLFSDEHSLSTHLNLVHRKKYEKICDICYQSLPNLEALTLHMEKHDGTQPSIACDICGLLVKNQHNLKLHVKMKHSAEGGKEHACYICQKVSLTANALDHHIRRNHRTGFIHKCTVCGKAFKRLDHLKIHSNIHTGNKLYKCSWCVKLFRVKSSLRYHHKNIHRKEWEEEQRSINSGNFQINNSPSPSNYDNEN